jgi:chromosome segregation ATPase
MKTTREAYINRVKDQLDELNEAIETLQEKGEAATGAAKEKFEEKLHELGTLREDLSANLDALRITTEDSWYELRETLDSSLDRVSEIARDSLRKMLEFFK